MTPLTNARSQFFLATHVCLLENANSCGQNTSPPWFLVKSSIACSWTSMSQHLPTSISYTKLEIATYMTNYFPVLLPSIYYLVLHSLHPKVLCTRELAKITSQYYFVLQNLYKVLPSTTLYYKACTKSFPVYYNLQLQNWISMPKRQKDDFEALFKKNFKRKITSAKIAKSADKSLSQPGCSHSNTIYEIQLQNTILLRMQPRHRATLTQPLQCDLRRMSCKSK